MKREREGEGRERDFSKYRLTVTDRLVTSIVYIISKDRCANFRTFAKHPIALICLMKMWAKAEW